MKKVTVICTALLAVTAFAGAVTNTAGKVRRVRGPRMTMAERILMIEGEKMHKPGTGKGKIVFVDAQSSLREGKLAKWIETASLNLSLRMESVKGKSPDIADAAAAARKTGGNAVIFVVESDTLPLSLVAYEGAWGIANIKPVLKGVPTGIGEARAKKLIMRTMSNTCGAGEGMFPSPLMAKAFSPEDLDSIVYDDDFLPPLAAAVGKYMTRAGMESTTVASYRKACQEGWAPKPANERQQKIWDKVYAAPSNPVKITK